MLSPSALTFMVYTKKAAGEKFSPDSNKTIYLMLIIATA